MELAAGAPHADAARRAATSRGGRNGGPRRRRLFSFAELREGLAAVTAELPFQDWDADPAGLPAPARRLIAAPGTVPARRPVRGAAVGVLEPLALPYRSYRQAFTDSLVADLYGDQVDAGMLRRPAICGRPTWWLPSGRVFYSPGE